jgi:hypothetical protein
VLADGSTTGNWNLFLDETHVDGKPDPAFADCVARAAPPRAAFDFDSDSGFFEEAERALSRFCDVLAVASFRVRLHPRRSAEQLPSVAGERRLAGIVDVLTRRAGAAATVRFHDAADVVAVNTVDGRAGLGDWTRAQRLRYPLLTWLSRLFRGQRAGSRVHRDS